MIGRVAPLVLLSLASPARADDSCRLAGDGTCDELVACALGTDSSDCGAACGGAIPRDLAGPCAHHAAVGARRAVTAGPDTGSHGQGGPTGLWSGTIVARGNDAQQDLVRHFEVYVPPTVDPRVPAPVLYMLAGFTVDMYGLAAYTELVRTADLEGVILVFPQQHDYDFGPDIGWVFAWNVYRTDWAGGDWLDNPDVDFVRELTSELESLYNVDRTRIFASGHSRGAAMSIILAFTLPGTVAGFLSEMGFVEANRYYQEMDAWEGDRKIPAVLVAGTWDQDVPVDNADLIAEVLTDGGWVQGRDFAYYRLEDVAHEWQPQLNQEAWDFLSSRPLPADEVGP